MTEKIKNVMIFVADALRWDYLPKKIKDLGVTIKTIAQSCHTPTSFASIVTGLNPPKHKVDWFTDIIPKNIFSLFDLKINTSYYSGNLYDPINRVFGSSPRISLSEIKEPFIYLEKNTNTHTPYNPTYNGTARDYTKKYGKKPDIYIPDYKNAVQRSTMNFVDRIDILEKRGMLDDTLLIYTSDHGELLGEYGLLGHSFPCTPELVYVPTVFIHSNIEKLTLQSPIMRHIDLLPTILKLLNLRISNTFEGVDIFSIEDQLLGYNRTVFPALYPWRIVSSSIWKENAGFVQLGGSSWKKYLILMQELLIRSRTLSPFVYCQNERQFGDPIENVKEILDVFSSQYTYGFEDNIYLKPEILNEVSLKEKTRKKIFKIKQRIL